MNAYYRWLVLISGIFYLSLFSCTSIGKYIPDPNLANGVASNMKDVKSVKLVNDQPSTKEHLLPVRDILIDYNSFTQSIVEALRKEFERNGVQVKEASEKILFISIVSVKMPPPGINYRAYISADVKTGDNVTKNFITTRASYASPFNMSTFPTKPIDSAFRDLAKDILENDYILNYLKD